MHNFDAYLGGNRPLIRTITPLYVTRSCRNQETETNVFTSLVNTTQISGKARKKIGGVGGGGLVYLSVDIFMNYTVQTNYVLIFTV